VNMTDVAIIGAGPYGLSLAAHLRRYGLDFRIFGQPMEFWNKIAQSANHRYLKSFGFGTNIYTPEEGYSFAEYCQERGLESFEPCPISDFANYGIWVQQNIIPNVERSDVTKVARINDFYRLVLSSGEELFAKRVVVATGLTSFAVLPPELAHLPNHLVTHTAEISSFKCMRDRAVCVVGAGQSALEAAMLLHETGARPHIIARGPQIAWNKRVSHRRAWWHKLRSPISGLGTGPKAWLLTTFPSAVHYAPTKWRVRFVKGHLPAEGAWWLRGYVERDVPISLNCTLISAKEKGGRVVVSIHDLLNGNLEFVCDHIIAGTGFKVNVDHLSFLDVDLRASVRRIENAPKLDRHFESSVRGLFFVGPSSALSFGPLFRFVVGASYAAPFLSTHLASKKTIGPRARTCNLMKNTPIIGTGKTKSGEAVDLILSSNVTTKVCGVSKRRGFAWTISNE
jgi:FAD-dependent urate hydroxylase